MYVHVEYTISESRQGKMPSKQSIGEKKLSCLDRDSNTQLHTCGIQPRVLAFIAGMIVFRVDPSLLHLRVSMLPTLWRYIHGLFNHKLWSYIHVWFNSRFVSSCDIMCHGACDMYRRLLTFFMYTYVHVLFSTAVHVVMRRMKGLRSVVHL